MGIVVGYVLSKADTDDRLRNIVDTDLRPRGGAEIRLEQPGLRGRNGELLGGSGELGEAGHARAAGVGRHVARARQVARRAGHQAGALGEEAHGTDGHVVAPPPAHVAHEREMAGEPLVGLLGERRRDRFDRAQPHDT